MRIPIAILATFSMLLSGCAQNAYRKYYHDDLQGAPLAQVPNIAQCDGPLKVVQVAPEAAENAAHELLRDGYMRIGWSSFHGAGKYFSEIDLRDQAEKVGACVALSTAKYRNTNTSAVPLILPHNSTSYTNANATAYGPSGVTNAYGTATTTTYGTQTTFIPVSTEIYDGEAAYFVKRKYQFGLNLLNVEQSDIQRIGRNGAYKVVTVVRGTPAFESDILEGDFILEIDGRRFSTMKELFEYVGSKKGSDITVSLWRNGETLTKTVGIAN